MPVNTEFLNNTTTQQHNNTTTQHAVKLNFDTFVNSNVENTHSNHWLMVCVHY